MFADPGHRRASGASRHALCDDPLRFKEPPDLRHRAGRSEGELAAFRSRLQGREKVKVVCIDLSSSYRAMVRRWFPNARIVADRFHVVRVVQRAYPKVCVRVPT
jgi:transposase